MKRYRDFPSWLREQYGGKTFKVSLTANTTCPNIDGTLAKGGCTFCNDAAYAPLSEGRKVKSITEQLDEGIAYIRKRHQAERFIAYFQSFTSTYGSISTLLPKFQEASDHPAVAGLALSTRPDCLNAEWAKALQQLMAKKSGWLELGLQSANNETLKRINRCHTKEQFGEAVMLWKEYGSVPLCAHVVLGLPGETKQDILATAGYLASLPIDAVKIHNLHVVKGTQLAQEFLAGEYRPLTLEEYVDWTIAFLEATPSHFVIHRLNAHAPRHLTLAPDWSVNKLGTVNAVEQEMERRNSWQGKNIKPNRDVVVT